MSKSTLPTAPTAAQVRSFAKANPAKFSGLSERAAHTLGSRGRLHPEVIAAYNKGRVGAKRYVLGATGAAKAERQAFRAKAVAAGAGKRGPLSKSVQATLAVKG